METGRPRKILTFLLVIRGGRVLLGMKKRGFGAGWWNGFGGKVEAGESIEDAARREAMEEIGVAVPDVEKIGILEFEFAGQKEILQVHVFRTASFSGEPRESDEMRPQWFAFGDVPYADMWPDDPLWLPLALAGQKFRGRVLFDDSKKILEHSIIEAHEI